MERKGNLLCNLKQEIRNERSRKEKEKIISRRIMCKTLFLKQKVDPTMQPKSSEGVARGQSTSLAFSGPRIPPSAEFT